MVGKGKADNIMFEVNPEVQVLILINNYKFSEILSLILDVKIQERWRWESQSTIGKIIIEIWH